MDFFFRKTQFVLSFFIVLLCSGPRPMALRFETSGSVRRPAPTNCPAGGRLPPLANRAAWRSEGRRHISNGRRSIPSLPGKLSAEGRRMRHARLEARVIGGRPVEGRRAYRQRANHSSARPLQTRAAESLPGAPRPEAPEQIRQRLRRGSPSGFARKWRRKGLKRLNPRPEMVWPRKRRTHNIWYKSATATRRAPSAVARDECWAPERGTEIFLAAKP